MKILDVVNAFSTCPEIQEVSNSIFLKRRSRKSKLQPHTELILKFWAAGKSLQFICNRLRQYISCARSTVSRFIKKLVSL